ncbi:MAG: hypothetical protein JXB07_17520 [Anaerolineae bacterium]|nr:hypothetical protein [Anaerolineae bacterium]
MTTKLLDAFTRFATVRNILIFLGLFILLNMTILPMAAGRIDADSQGVGPIDLQFTYTSDQVYDLIDAYGQDGRGFYTIFELTGDVIYPIINMLWLSLALTYLSNRIFDMQSRLRGLALLPLGCFVADLLENIGIVVLLANYPRKLSWLIPIISVFTSIKWIVFGASLILLLLGLGILVYQRVRANR